jgi:hypothetical protein
MGWAPQFSIAALGRSIIAVFSISLRRRTIDGTQRQLALFKRPEDAEHLFDGLRKAGLPER